MSFFRGTSIDQDSRYFSQHKKLLAKLKFPACFDQKVDLTKVKLEVINQWITERVTQILGFEDDIVVSMIINLLEPKVDQKLDPREMQITITGFLEKEAPSFMKELWELLLSAQAHPTGIPAELLEKKKQEMAKAAKEKADLRQVLDRKQQEAGHARPAGPGREGRGGRGRGRFADRREDSHGDRESSRPSNFRHRDDGDRRSERRRSPRRRRRSPSRSRSRSRTRRSSRRHSRSASRSKSRSRTPPRRRRSSRRSPSSSASDRSRSRSPRRSPPRRRRYSSSKSPSPDRRRRERRRSHSSSASS